MSIMDDAGEYVKSSDFQDLIITYRAMVDAMRLETKLTNEGKKEKFDQVRYFRLEIKVNHLWSVLSRPEQLAACNELVKTDHMPQTFADILLMSGGTINMEQPPEPCWRA
jgi:hypothetical protein